MTYKRFGQEKLKANDTFFVGQTHPLIFSSYLYLTHFPSTSNELPCNNYHGTTPRFWGDSRGFEQLYLAPSKGSLCFWAGAWVAGVTALTDPHPGLWVPTPLSGPVVLRPPNPLLTCPVHGLTCVFPAAGFKNKKNHMQRKMLGRPLDWSFNWIILVFCPYSIKSTCPFS